MTLQTRVLEISAHVDGSGTEDLACADLGARTPIGVSGNLFCFGLFVTGSQVVSTNKQTKIKLI